MAETGGGRPAGEDGPPSRPGDAADLEAAWAALAAERRDVERLRRDLLSTVSHELRTPLTLIRTSIGLLLDSRPDEAMRQRLLGNIKESTDRMHRLVTDILDLARLRSGRPELRVQRVDLGELVSGAATLMGPLLAEKRQTLTVDAPAPAPAVLGDLHRLERVLLNLVSNAHKFSPPGARVAVRVTPAAPGPPGAPDEADAAEVAVGVSDTGPGIPPEAQRHLFERFFIARPTSPDRQAGAGLGLPIARGIVEAHGGRMWVESQPGAGSTFWFTLPVGGPPAGDGEGGEGEEDGDEAAGGG
jgi:signal transduction histidine kinase